MSLRAFPQPLPPPLLTHQVHDQQPPEVIRSPERLLKISLRQSLRVRIRPSQIIPRLLDNAESQHATRGQLLHIGGAASRGIGERVLEADEVMFRGVSRW